MSNEEYEIHAVKYAHLARATAFIGADPHDGGRPMDYFVWVVRNALCTVVVDTGYDAAMAARRGRQLERPVGEGLAALGIAPASVQDVVITHLHYDHAGNHDLFPAARFHLQEQEMAFATGPCMCHQPLRHGYEVDDVTAMVRRVFEDKVRFCRGASEIAPGIEVHHLGGHTAGQQVVRVRTRSGWVVLASDASHFYVNMEESRPFPLVYNVFDMLEGYRRMRGLASSAAQVVPGHDPQVLQRYPASLPGSEGWIVRLDAPLR